MNPNSRRAFTVLELVTVLAIIAVLVSLTVVGVQYARESSHKIECLNNVKQQTTAAVSHHVANNAIPSGGWGSEWVGEARRGFGPAQPGGWIYSLLPYMEQNNLHELPSGKDQTELRRNTAKLMQQPVAVFVCPSRRSAVVYEYTSRTRLRNCDPIVTAAKSDYAVNLAVSFVKSELSFADLRDGLAQTILCGEKRLLGGASSSAGDESGMYIGSDDDIARSASVQPLADRAKASSSMNGSGGLGFGAAHVDACYFGFFDGAARPLSYDVDPEVFRQLGNPRDGRSIELPF